MNNSRQLSTTIYTAPKTALHIVLLYLQVRPSFSPIRLPAISSPRPPVLASPFFLPPPLINRAPSLNIIRTASSMYSIIAHKERKPPHATFVAINGEISAVENDG